MDFLGHQRAERGQDVGVILDALFLQLDRIALVVEHLRAGVVLAEGVVTEQHGVAGHIGGHAVRPVQHRHLDEY
ncbi:hypothetical protein D3C78_1845190 [compost metagenome]